MKTRIGFLIAFAVAGLLLPAIAAGQEPPPGPPPDGQMQPRMQHPPMGPMDPLGEAMFPPEMIMQHTRELNLSDAQKQFMRAEIQKTTTRFNELQWQLQDAVEALHQTLKANPVNEEQALAQLDTAAIPPTAQVIPLRNVMREDAVRPSWPVEDVLRNAPATRDQQFLVPPVLE